MSIQPITGQQKDAAAEKAKVDTELKKQRLINLRLEKKEASPAKMKRLVKEESKLSKDIKTAAGDAARKDKADHKARIKTHKTGDVRPHYKNVTEKSVEEAIGETPEQQAKDFTNWFVFDIPTDQTGVGSSAKNPLVGQNEARERFLGEGTLYKHFNTTYALTGGIEERKEFFVQHNRLIKAGVDRGLLTEKVLSEEESFLKKFDYENNGLFPQDQSKKELNHWHNQHQTPNDFFGGVMYPMQQTTNPSILKDGIRDNSNLLPKV